MIYAWSRLPESKSLNLSSNSVVIFMTLWNVYVRKCLNMNEDKNDFVTNSVITSDKKASEQVECSYSLWLFLGILASNMCANFFFLFISIYQDFVRDFNRESRSGQVELEVFIQARKDSLYQKRQTFTGLRNSRSKQTKVKFAKHSKKNLKLSDHI